MNLVTGMLGTVLIGLAMIVSTVLISPMPRGEASEQNDNKACHAIGESAELKPLNGQATKLDCREHELPK